MLDFTWTSQSADSAPFEIVPTPPTTFSNPELANVDLKYFGTARARVGYVLPTWNSMIYATGGVAWARASMSVTGQAFSPATGTVNYSVADTANFVGWAAGLGIDWMFAPNWTAGIEYLHLDFGDANFRFPGPFPNTTTQDALAPGTNVSLTSDIVRGTINRRF